MRRLQRLSATGGGLSPSLPRISELLPARTQPLAPAPRVLLGTLGCCTLASCCFQMSGRLGPTWVLPRVSVSHLNHQNTDLTDANIFTASHVSARALSLHHTQLPASHDGGGELPACKAREASCQGSFLLPCFPEQNQSAICSAAGVLQRREGTDTAPRAAMGLRACSETPCTETLAGLTFPEFKGEGIDHAHQHSFMCVLQKCLRII